ncbi:MAG: dihydrodipicolinate synthase family protein [Enterobacter hormaechei]
MLYNGYDEIFAPACWPARTGIGSTYNIMGWRCQAIAKAVREGDNATAQTQSECNTVIDLLIKAGVRGLKTVLHYMDVVSGRCAVSRLPLWMNCASAESAGRATTAEKR